MEDNLGLKKAGTGLKSAGVLLVLLWVLLVCMPISALNPNIKITQYLHDAWKLKEGLPQNTVQDILQTGDGYLWLTTQEGLARFDGVKFTVFDKNNTPSLRSQWLWPLHEDRSGVLWIGAYGGGVTCLKEGTFFTPGDNGLTNSVVRAFCEDKQGRIWIGTDGNGLFSIKDGQVTHFTQKEGLADNRIRALCSDSKGDLWVGTLNSLSRFREGRFKTYTTANGLADNVVYAIHEDRKGRLWIGTKEGLNCMDAGAIHTFTKKHGLNDNYVKSLLEDRDHNLWIGTNKGVHRLKEGDYKHFRRNCTHILDQYIIWALHEDKEGSLWIGTGISGLHRIREGRLTTYSRREGLAHDYVKCILPGPGNSLWIGTSGGLNYVKERVGVPEHFETFLPGITIHSLCRDRLGNLWIGTARTLKYLKIPSTPEPLEPHVKQPPQLTGERLLQKRNPAGNRISASITNIWTSGYIIRSICEDREHNLWVGTSKGVTRLKDGRPLTFQDSEKLNNTRVSAILQDREGRIWFGTRSGLHYYKDNRLTTYTQTDGLCHNWIKSLYEDDSGALWIGTAGGISRIKKGAITSITSRQGLFDDNICHVLEDDNGYLWVSCNKGIFRMIRQLTEACLEGRRRSIRCNYYNQADGMKSRDCSGGDQPAGCKSSDGNLWFPTIGGAVEVDPRKLTRKAPPPLVKIERLLADHKPLPLYPLNNNNNIIIPPGTKRLEIHYTALSLRIPDRVLFKTKLSGYDPNWSDSIKKRSVDYTNLSSGTFTFQVTACNSDGVWNKTGASVKFHSKSTFIQTPWFYLLCGFLLSTLLLLGHRLHIGKLKKNENKLRTMVDERTSALQERNNELLAIEKAIRAINREIRMDNVLHALLDKAMELFPRAQAGAFLIYDQHSGKYSVPACHNMNSKMLEKMTHFHDRVRRFVIDKGEELEKDIYFFKDFAGVAKTFKIDALLSFHSLLIVDTRVDDMPRGLLLLGTHDIPLTFGAWDVHKLILFREHSLYALVRAGAMQDMAAMAEKRTLELSQTNKELKNKITELTSAREELEKAGERVERANMVKTRFLTNISHEIRTPMNSIIGFSEIMVAELNNKRYNGFLKTIIASGQTLLGLINDILDLSKIEAGKIELHYGPVNPVSLLGEIKHMFQQESREKNVTIKIIICPNIPELLELDRPRIRQILFNLVGNAVKFTKNGFVTLAVKVKNQKNGPGLPVSETADVVFTVRDTGIGIPAEQQEIIFEIFRQSDDIDYEQYSGTGLGLGISRRLTELMNGTITVESEVGKGSIFTVTLPGIRISGLSETVAEFSQLEITETDKDAPVVLVVDDEETNRSLLAQYLNHCGINTMEAENGKAAVRLALMHYPELILMDVRMPVMNGIEATRAIKADPVIAHIPVVALTAYDNLEEQLTGNHEMFDDCLFKPVSQEKILEKVFQFIPGLADDTKEKDIKKEKETKPEQTAAEKKELVTILHSRLTELWQEVKKTYILNDIKSFGEEAQELGLYYHSLQLENWAAKLITEIDAFDIENAGLTLDTFPQMIEEIENEN
ncbi:MAG: response regulator [bacterium]|nr:response regulator [bacterium]